MNPALEKTYVIRPLMEERTWLRYDDGKWSEDDGEPDLAFVTSDPGIPYFLYVGMPYYEGILWAWQDNGVWHYAVEDPAQGWGKPWPGKEEHPNEIADHQAANKCGAMWHCGNGIGPHINSRNEWIDQGKLWVRETMEVVVMPTGLECYLCANDKLGHRRKDLKEALRTKRLDLELLTEDTGKAERRIAANVPVGESYEREIAGLEGQLAGLV